MNPWIQRGSCHERMAREHTRLKLVLLHTSSNQIVQIFYPLAPFVTLPHGAFAASSRCQTARCTRAAELELSL